MSTPFTENDRLRLEHPESQANALMRAISRFAPYVIEKTPSDWIRAMVGRMLHELKSVLPDDEYLRHLEPSGISLDAPDPAPAENYLELTALLEFLVSAATFWTRESPGMGSRPA